MQRKPKSVLLAYIHNGMVHEFFMQSVIRYLREDAKRDNTFRSLNSSVGLYLDVNRNASSERFMTTDAEILLFVDTDIGFTTDQVYTLIDSIDPDTSPIVSGLYFGYIGTTRMLLPVWFQRNQEGKIGTTPEISPGMQRIVACGMGFCAIHRSAMERINERYPSSWFDRVTEWDKEQKRNLGEDMAFCWRAAELGIPIYGNADVVVDHMKSRPENFETFLRHWNIPVPADQPQPPSYANGQAAE